MTNTTNETKQAAIARGKALLSSNPQEPIIRYISEHKRVYEALCDLPSAAGDEVVSAFKAREKELHKKITDCTPHTMQGVSALLDYIAIMANENLYDEATEALNHCRIAIDQHRDNWKIHALHGEAYSTIGALYDNTAGIKRNMDLITRFVDGLNNHLKSVIDTAQIYDERPHYNNCLIALSKALLKDLKRISDMVEYRLADAEESDQKQAARIAAMAATAAA